MKKARKSLTALRACFKSTIPVLTGYIFLGITYGILMRTSGFPWWLATLQAFVIYTGSMEFLMVSILASSFNPASAAVTALMVGSRHLFYGLSMLDKYRGTGFKKFYLIYTTSDETFAINYSAEIPEDIDRGWFYFWVSFLDQIYWATGALIGSLCGGLIKFSTNGLDFVMTAMFVVIFMNQWMKDQEDGKKIGLQKMQGIADAASEGLKHAGHNLFWKHLPSVIGIVASVICLLIFGPDRFIIPSMILILVLLALAKPAIERADASVDDEAVQPEEEKDHSDRSVSAVRESETCGRNIGEPVTVDNQEERKETEV